MFHPTVLEGQLCYQLDFSLIETNNTRAGLKNGFLFTIDSGISNSELEKGAGEDAEVETLSLDPTHADDHSPRIYLNTLARFTDFRAGSYALSVVKMMTGTKKFMALADEIKNCHIDKFEGCNVKGYIKVVQDKCGCVPWFLKSAVSVEVRVCH